MDGEETFRMAETGNWTPNSAVKGSGANHSPRAPALLQIEAYWTHDGSLSENNEAAWYRPTNDNSFPEEKLASETRTQS